MRTKFKNVANLLFIVLFASCNREGIVENDGLSDNGKIAVATEITVDGVEITTRAATEAGYTTGDGLYDKGDPVTVAAFANDGYELTAFYDKKYPSTNLGVSHDLRVSIPQTFKAEFHKKSFTITVNASPTEGGTVTGGESYNKGSSCTVTATPKSGYIFDGWYEGSTKVSSNSSYSFTVSSNRTMTARFSNSAKTFYFSTATRGGSIHGVDRYIEFKKGDQPITITAIPEPGYIFEKWDTSDDGGWGDRPELTIDDSFFDQFADETTFYFYFEKGTRQFTISLKSKEWNPHFKQWSDIACLVGFAKNDLTLGEKTIQATEGDVITVYAEGKGDTAYPGESVASYCPLGFYSIDYNPYKLSSGSGLTDSYSFVVSGNKTIIVGFQRNAN